MFIKNIVIGVLGFIFFPSSYFLLNNLNFSIWGITTSIILILFYFVNVYVIGKIRSFFTVSSSWIIILSLCIPLGMITHGDLKIILIYTGIVSTSISWLMILIELIVSETFKGH